MITKAESIPVRSNKGLQGQEILWTQFNEVSFFIEDDFQENLYFQILKKLFPNIKIGKIFPLGGKEFVIAKANKSIANNKKVFIVDNDFDEILGVKTILSNLFYLQRYSIENYLFEQSAIYELIREENPKISSNELRTKFSINSFITSCASILSELSAHFFLIRKFELGLRYLRIEPNRDCDFTSVPYILNASFVKDFFLDVKRALKLKKPRLKYSTQLNLAKKHFKATKALINIPGKYLSTLLKVLLRRAFHFVQCSSDTFIYRLMKNCNLNSLVYLKSEVEIYCS